MRGGRGRRRLGRTVGAVPGQEVVAVAAGAVRRVPRGVLVAVALAGGCVWWWAVGRLAFAPAGETGVLEASIAAGGWGIGLLPVHSVPWARAVGPRRVRASYRARARRQAQWRRTAGAVRGRWGTITTAWRRRRWGGGSGPS